MKDKKECTCDAQDLQPFGECVCGASSSREVFDLPELSFIEQSNKVYENELLRLITWLQKEPTPDEFYSNSPDALLYSYLNKLKYDKI
jgi:hypothetical protein